mmetsp:Transcript_2887/g.5487  ORF Transcript_2887/g.5487 Transcript_2887/m.5487 type:complete len:97 (+) Transcript_2887:1129-1419(+)
MFVQHHTTRTWNDSNGLPRFQLQQLLLQMHKQFSFLFKIVVFESVFGLFFVFCFGSVLVLPNWNILLFKVKKQVSRDVFEFSLCIIQHTHIVHIAH